ncbi:MAG: efflux RND transporter periplasmic adaptor subunit [Planctomycetota bacterium]|nr:efflux RND transporter periplasmic adaptor subunit [Planctomycetota bacterium]
MNHLLKILPRLGTVLLVLFLGIALGRCFTPMGSMSGSSSHDHEATEGVAANATEAWTCSMHPSIKAPKEGDCPICGMDLIPLETGTNTAADGPNILRLEEGQKALAGIRTSLVRRADAAHKVRLVGKLAVDETAIAILSAYVGGRLDRLYVDYTGLKVRAGDHLAEIYSPQLFHAQEELIVAVESAKRFGAQSDESLIKISHSTVVAARKKLTLYGLTEEQMQEIVDLGEPSEQITLSAPIGGTVIHRSAVEGQYVKEGEQLYTIANLDQLWLELDAYESDLPWIRYGQQVTFSVDAWPGETFSGSISFLDPVLDSVTRTVHVRVEVDNSDGRLRPAMFARATVSTPIVGNGQAAPVDMHGKWICPMHPEVIAEESGICRICEMDLETAESLGFASEMAEMISPLLIPATAPLLTGDRAIVFVEIQNVEQHGASIFEARDIVLGPRAGDDFVVREGLMEGESVVTRGSFTIDSEMQLRGKQSMMAPDGGGVVGHNHGGMNGMNGMKDMKDTKDTPMELEMAEDDFRKQNGVLLMHFAALGESLASDALHDSHSQVKSFQTALTNLKGTSLPESAQATIGLLEKAAEAATAAEDIERLRKAFFAMQTPMVHLAESYGYLGVERELSIFHCPMAMGDGADWIDFTGDGTRNPYYGASMLKCGDETRALKGFTQQ